MRTSPRLLLAGITLAATAGFAVPALATDDVATGTAISDCVDAPPGTVVYLEACAGTDTSRASASAALCQTYPLPSSCFYLVNE